MAETLGPVETRIKANPPDVWTLGTPANGATMYEGSIKKLKDNIEDLAHVADKSVQVIEQSFSIPEKIQARKNIGAVSKYTIRSTANVVETFNHTVDSVAETIELSPYMFQYGHEYHLFLNLPSEIQLDDYEGDKALIYLWVGCSANIGASNVAWRLVLRADVIDGYLKPRQSFIPVDFYGNTDLDPSGALKPYLHVSIHDSVYDAEHSAYPKAKLVIGQSLTFNLRGTDSHQEDVFNA